MSRRKILLIASWYPTSHSPVNGIFIHDQAQALSQEYDVAVLAPRIAGWREMLHGKIGPRSQLQKEGNLLVSRERVLAPVPRAPVWAYRNWLPAAARGFAKLLAQWGRPDLIHAQVVLPGGLSAVRLGKQHGIPVVLTEHTSPFSAHLKTAPLRRWVQETLAQSNRVLAVSPALAQQIQAFDKTIEIHIVGNLINTDFFVPIKTERHHLGKTHFLSVGLLTPQKGINFLLQAAARLLQRGLTAFELIIGSDGPERPRLERLTQTLGLQDYCHFTGMLTREQVKQRMQQCDVFVLPSLHETFGLVLAEAMACGKPVIATRCGGPEFVVTPETGVLIDVANPEVLANAMANFITAPLDFDSQRVRQSVVERFGKEIFLSKISTVYEQVWSSQ